MESYEEMILAWQEFIDEEYFDGEDNVQEIYNPIIQKMLMAEKGA